MLSENNLETLWATLLRISDYDAISRQKIGNELSTSHLGISDMERTSSEIQIQTQIQGLTMLTSLRNLGFL